VDVPLTEGLAVTAAKSPEAFELARLSIARGEHSLELSAFSRDKIIKEYLQIMRQSGKACRRGRPEIRVPMLAPSSGIAKELFVCDLLAPQAVGDETETVPNAELNGAIGCDEGSRGELPTRSLACFAEPKGEAVWLQNWSQ
jgi:hypothetical protein